MYQLTSQFLKNTLDYDESDANLFPLWYFLDMRTLFLTYLF